MKTPLEFLSELFREWLDSPMDRKTNLEGYASLMSSREQAIRLETLDSLKFRNIQGITCITKSDIDATRLALIGQKTLPK